MGWAAAQSHFTAVQPTGLPYIIVITNATIDNNVIPAGTEIAAFDGALCVGDCSFAGTFNVPLTVWRGDPSNSLAGFTQGDSILFKIFVPGGSGKEYTAGSIYTQGNGTFGSGSFSAVKLLVVTTGLTENTSLSAQSNELTAYPNPFNGTCKFRFNIFGGTSSLRIVSISGETIYEKSFAAQPGIKEFTWNGRNAEGRVVNSGLYFAQLRSLETSKTVKILMIK